MRKDLKYWNAFNQSIKIGPKNFKKLYSYFSDLEKAWKASEIELTRANLEPEIIKEILSLQKNIDPDKEMEKVEKCEIKITTIKDKDYPSKLKKISNAPIILYIKGEFKLADEFAISIVGTRKPTSYGRQTTSDIATELAFSGITIVSGLALGVDAIAHKSALDAKGRTIAVLGCGLDNIYPITNSNLADLIEKNGAIISEYPLGMPPLKQHFPARNRIISGLSLGTLITEAGEKSGALITGRFALEQNREVFAVSGSIYNQNSLGPNNLIKMGAKLVSSASDILDELNLESAQENIKARKIIPDTKEEAVILEIIKEEPAHIDLIVQKSELEAGLVNSVLTMMEIKGKVRNLGNMNYGLRK